MNEQLIKFIELCLIDGVVTDKEREVIFRKSKEFGVPEDECEIILEGMIQQKGGVSEVQNIPKKVISTEKKELKLTFNNLNQTKVLKNDISDLELELKEKETLINESNKEIQKILKELNETVKPNEIVDIFLETPYSGDERGKLEGGQILNKLTSLLSIDKTFFSKTTPSLEGILLLVRIWIDKRYFIIFKKEKNEIVRFMISEKRYNGYWDDVESLQKKYDKKFPDEDINYNSLKTYVYVNKPYNLLIENINLIDEKFLKIILSENEILNLTKEKLVDKIQEKFTILEKGFWEGDIVNEDILDLELELFNNLSHKVYLK